MNLRMFHLNQQKYCLLVLNDSVWAAIIKYNGQGAL